MRDFSRALSKFQIIARNYDWFIALFAPVVIGRSNCFGFGFFDSHLKTALMIKAHHIMMKAHHIYNGETPSYNDKTTSRYREL